MKETNNKNMLIRKRNLSITMLSSQNENKQELNSETKNNL